MKTFRQVLPFLVALALAGLALPAHSQTSYNRFGPATGILVGDSTTYYTTAATSANVLGLWSGTCNSGTFLRGDGACAVPSGTGVTSVGLTVPSGLSVSGSPVTSTGTLAISTTLNGPVRGTGTGLTTGATALGSEVSGTLPVANGGTGVTSSTGTGSVVLSASPTLTGTTTVATLAATAATVGGSNVCRADGTDCPAGGGDATLAGTQTFTGQNTFSRTRGAAGEYAMVFQSAQPSTLFYDNDSAANEKGWRISADSGALLHYAMNDADTSGTIWMQVDRTATAIDSVALNSALLRASNTAGQNFTQCSTGNTAANQCMNQRIDTGGDLRFQISDDAGAGVATYMAVDRTGTTVDSIAFTAPTVSASTAFTPDADLGAAIGTSVLRFSEGHIVRLCEAVCANTETIGSSGTTVYLGAGSDWTDVNIPNVVAVEGSSTPRIVVNDTGGVSTSDIRFSDNGVSVGLVASANAAGQCIAGSSARDMCMRNDASGAIRFSVDSGTSTAVAISNAGALVVTGSTMTVNGQNVCLANGTNCPGGTTKTAYAFVQSNGAITGGGITAVGITSVTVNSTGNYTVNFTGSFFSAAPACTSSPNTSLLGANSQTANASTSSVVVLTNDSTPTASSQAFNIVCTGPA